jgi:tRNA-Thr(GGU) m(6)t(6)A37 methyltransferase TsaA
MSDVERCMNQIDLIPIGRVESTLTSRQDAPRQPDEGAPPAWLVFEPTVREALRSLRAGDSIVLLTWLDQARRDVQSVYPRGDTARPLTGVFSTRSPDRPNPIGLHEVEVVAVDDLRVQVRHLEAVDGTPIVDVKPALDAGLHNR